MYFRRVYITINIENKFSLACTFISSQFFQIKSVILSQIEVKFVISINIILILLRIKYVFV